MMANAYNVPVIICCETYKVRWNSPAQLFCAGMDWLTTTISCSRQFCERVQLDSICSNELGDPDQLIATDQGSPSKNVLDEWRDIPSLKLLNLVYDLTPIQYVSMVVTEVGMTPPTSVPVLIREQRKDKSFIATDA